MALNTSKRDAVVLRRQKVARQRLHGKTQQEIAVQLGVSVATVNADIKANDARWRKAANVDTATLRGRQLAEIAEIKRIAWAQIYDTAQQRTFLQAVKLEAQITGTVAPPTFNFNFAVLMPIVEALQNSGVPPQEAGEAFSAWFKDYAERRQQQEAQLEDGR